MQCLEAACHGTRLQNRPRPHRPRNALEAPRPKVIELEETAEKSSRALGDDDRIRLGDALQARRKVGRLAYYAALLRLIRWDQVTHHDESGCNANPDLLRSARLELSHRRSQIKPSPYRSLRIVLTGVRIPKVHEDAIPQISGDEPAEVVHGLRDPSLIGRNDLSQVFRVHAGRKRGRTDQVRKHHRDLAALGSVLGLRFGQRRLWRSRNGTGKLRNRCQHLSPMPERDAKLFEILIGQMTEDGGIDVVLGKAPGVLGQAERSEPVLNSLHRGPPSRIYS